MSNFNLYPGPILPLTGTERTVLAQFQNGQWVTCSVEVNAFGGGGGGGSGILPYGPTDDRPGVPDGTMVLFFDTTLGQPVWGNDNDNWFNAAGQDVTAGFPPAGTASGGAIPFGPTNGRPTVQVGTMVIYFDTTLGQPIWGNSSQVWVNAAGASV